MDAYLQHRYSVSLVNSIRADLFHARDLLARVDSNENINGTIHNLQRVIDSTPDIFPNCNHFGESKSCEYDQDYSSGGNDENRDETSSLL